MQSLQLRHTGLEFHLDVRLNAHPEAHQDIALGQLTQQEGLRLEEAPEGIWRTRESLFASDTTVLRISTLPAKICSYADQLQFGQRGVEVRSVSQAVGLHDVALRGSADAIDATIRQLRADIVGTQATVTILQLNHNIDATAFAIPTPVLSLMQAIKNSFDPDGILGPGKFFGGV
jgi:glycolate oxidase FAD binding subunit